MRVLFDEAVAPFHMLPGDSLAVTWKDVGGEPVEVMHTQLDAAVEVNRVVVGEQNDVQGFVGRVLTVMLGQGSPTITPT